MDKLSQQDTGFLPNCFLNGEQFAGEAYFLTPGVEIHACNFKNPSMCKQTSTISSSHAARSLSWRGSATKNLPLSPDHAASLLPSLTSFKALIVPCSACLWFRRNLGSVPLREG